MKNYNSIKHTLLVFNSKETLVDTIIEQDKKIDKLENQLQQKENIIKEVREKINYYETTEWGIRGYEILQSFEKILDKVGDIK